MKAIEPMPHDVAQEAILRAWWGSPLAARLTFEEAQEMANRAIAALHHIGGLE